VHTKPPDVVCVQRAVLDSTDLLSIVGAWCALDLSQYASPSMRSQCCLYFSFYGRMHASNISVGAALCGCVFAHSCFESSHWEAKCLCVLASLDAAPVTPSAHGTSNSSQQRTIAAPAATSLVQDGPLCGFCETAVQYVKIALHNNQTVAQIEHAVDQLCDSAFAGLDAGPAQVSRLMALFCH